jgi:hypothetical protein
LYLIIAAIICGVLYMIVGMIPLPGPFNRICQIIIIAVFLIVVLYLLFALIPSMPSLPRGRL